MRTSPDSSCFKKTTRLPAYLPAKTMHTVPGVNDPRNLVLRTREGRLTTRLLLHTAVGWYRFGFWS